MGFSARIIGTPGWDGSDWKDLRVQSATYPNLRVRIYDSGTGATVRSAGEDDMSNTYNPVVTDAWLMGFNGTNWDRIRADPNRHLNVNIGGLSAQATGQVSIAAATVTTIKTANTSRKRIIVKNINATYNCAIGGSGVTYSTGFLLKPNEQIEIRSTAAIYGIVDGTNASNVTYWEE